MSKTFLANHRVGHASASGVTCRSSGTADSSGVVIDTRGWGTCTFVVQVHSACATASCQFLVKGGHTSASCAVGTSADLSGTHITAQSGSATGETGSGQLILIEVVEPQQRYLRLHATRGTEGNQFSAIYILSNPQTACQPQPIVPTNSGAFGVTDASAGNVTYAQHIAVAQGTA